jgi:hypothetical protein
MFCFITSLRSPEVSDDWSRICQLFERTAASVFNQTSPDFRMIAACSVRPTLTRSFDERLEFLVVDVPVPERTFESMMVDKVSKLFVALRRARDIDADYVMPLDADDLVSRKIVAHTLSHPEVDGWYVSKGWSYKYGTGWLEKLDNFNSICGSCNVVSRRWLSFPGHAAQERQADDDLIANGHAQVVEAFAARGGVLRPYPFRAAVYTVSNRENATRLLPKGNLRRSHLLRRMSGRIWVAGKTWMSRWPCTALQSEFALDRSPLKPHRPKSDGIAGECRVRPYSIAQRRDSSASP